MAAQRGDIIYAERQGIGGIITVGDIVDLTPKIFIQQTDPAIAVPYIWYQTDALGGLVSIWINT
jgi:hypothetical protein